MATKILLNVFLCCLFIINVKTATIPCQEKLDVVVMIDGSDSITEDEFTIFKSSLNVLVQRLDIVFDKTRLGLVLFSSDVTKSVNLSFDKFGLSSQIGALVQPQDGTNTHLAIEEAINIFNRNPRAGAAKVSIVITDGFSKKPDVTEQQANILKSLGVSSFAIGVTDKVKSEELLKIATDFNHVKNATSFNELTSTLLDLLPDICPPVTTVRTTPTTTTRPPPTPTPGFPTPTPRTSIDPLCEGCIMENGIGFAPHKTDCGKFIQCQETKDGVKGLIMDCPRGSYWHQEILTCNDMSKVTCLNDVCSRPGVTHFKSNYNCRQYYSCDDRLGAATCCQPLYSFSEAANQCVPDASCTADCGTFSAPASPIPCNKVEIPGKPHMYMEDVPGHGLLPRPCSAGTYYNRVDCQCSLFADVVNTVVTQPSPVNPVCKPELDLQFNTDARDSSGNNIWVQVNDVSFRDGSAVFNGNGILRVPRFANVPLGKAFRIKLRYKADSVAFAQQALVTNKDCDLDDSIAILANQQGHTFVAKNTNLAESQLNVLLPIQTQWQEVEFQVANGQFTGTVGSQSKTESFFDGILTSECALQIGHGRGYENFKGEIDYIQVFMC